MAADRHRDGREDRVAPRNLSRAERAARQCREGRMKAHWIATTVLFLSFATDGVRAQSDYPSKPVRIVVDSAAGSANDATARIIADRLSRIWNQQVLTLNQPGAGGSISTRVAAESPND